MEDVAPGTLRRFLIVTGNYVMAEDLKEILSCFGPTRIDVVTALEDPWPDACSIAFFGKSLDELIDDRRVQDLQRAGTHVVVLNGHSPDANADFEGTGFHLLDQPFRSEDVLSLLARLGMHGTAG